MQIVYRTLIIFIAVQIYGDVISMRALGHSSKALRCGAAI
jgi:hypothetical protein